jgi:hypothetical protein
VAKRAVECCKRTQMLQRHLTEHVFERCCAYLASQKPVPRYVILALERIVDMRGMVAERWLV